MHGKENIFEKLFDDTGEMLLARACLLQARSSCQEAPARHLGKTEQDIKGTTVSMCARIGEGRRMLVPQFSSGKETQFCKSLFSEAKCRSSNSRQSGGPDDATLSDFLCNISLIGYGLPASSASRCIDCGPGRLGYSGG